MTEPGAAPIRNRGRPRAEHRSDVPAELIQALRALLDEKSPAEVTLKDVADRAGRSQEMVRYYFQSKDGLMLACLKESIESIQSQLVDLQGVIAAGCPDPTRRILGTLIGIYLAEAHSSRIYAAELDKANSHWRDQFQTRWSGIIVERLEAMVTELVAKGHYRAGLVPRRAATILMVLASGPVRLISSLGPDWVDADALSSDDWLDDLVCAAEGLCRE